METFIIIFGSILIGIIMSLPLIYVFTRIQKRKEQFDFSDRRQQRFEFDSQHIIRNEKIIKTISLILIIIWITALLITWNSPAPSYESNIYTSTPQIFWIANILNFIFGIGTLIFQITYHKKNDKSKLWIVGFILIFLAFTSILSLWIIRDYVFLGEGDALTHLRFIKDIINTGNIKNTNYYPIAHIYIAQMTEITNISPNTLINLVTIIYVLLSIIFLYCLAKISLPRKEHALLVTVVWMAYVISNWVQFTPNAFANFCFPLAIFILLKCFFTEQIQWKILFVVMILLFPLFHPLVGFVLSSFILFMLLYDRLVNAEHSPITRKNSFYILATFLTLIIWCVYWTSAFQIWRNLIIDVVANITTGVPTNLNSLIGEITYASQYYSVLPVFFKTYTGLIIIISLTAFSLIVLWKKGIFKENSRRLTLLFSPMPILIIGIVFLYFSSAGFGPTRLMIFLVILSTLFVSYILFEIIKRSKIQDHHFNKSGIKFSAFSVVGISILLFFLFVVGFLQYYPSRYTLQLNLHITRTEFTGMNWFIENKEIAKEGASFSVDTYRWASLFLTQEEYIYQGYRYYGAQLPTNLRMPWHFGYDKKENLGQFYDRDIYMVLSSRDRHAYTDTWPEIASIRLQSEDFYEVEKDKSINKLYSNSGLDIYYINNIAVSFERDPFYWTK